MNRFEMRVTWGDSEEAYYRNLRAGNQDLFAVDRQACFVTVKLDHETDDQYQERTREFIKDRLMDLPKRPGFVGMPIVDSIKFQ